MSLKSVVLSKCALIRVTGIYLDVDRDWLSLSCLLCFVSGDNISVVVFITSFFCSALSSRSFIANMLMLLHSNSNPVK